MSNQGLCGPDLGAGLAVEVWPFLRHSVSCYRHIKVSFSAVNGCVTGLEIERFRNYSGNDYGKGEERLYTN